MFVYSFSSIGATVKTHVCAGKVQKCACAKTNKKDTCCNEQSTFVKKQDQHQSTTGASFSFTSLQIVLPAPVDFYNQLGVVVPSGSIVKNKFYSKKGQLFSSPPLYTLDCLYLI
ncbi:MAG: hypothetical protein RL188_862 [Bacteroidota bacterium]